MWLKWERTSITSPKQISTPSKFISLPTWLMLFLCLLSNCWYATSFWVLQTKRHQLKKRKNQKFLIVLSKWQLRHSTIMLIFKWDCGNNLWGNQVHSHRTIKQLKVLKETNLRCPTESIKFQRTQSSQIFNDLI